MGGCGGGELRNLLQEAALLGISSKKNPFLTTCRSLGYGGNTLAPDLPSPDASLLLSKSRGYLRPQSGCKSSSMPRCCQMRVLSLAPLFSPRSPWWGVTFIHPTSQKKRGLLPLQTPAELRGQKDFSTKVSGPEEPGAKGHHPGLHLRPSAAAPAEIWVWRMLQTSNTSSAGGVEGAQGTRDTADPGPGTLK